jgi:uncharacterized protein (TIGR02147 family)
MHLELRVTQNSRYSLRAYARDLGLTVSQLSQVLNKKLGLSQQSARKVAGRLGLSKTDTERFYDSVVSLHSRRTLDRKTAEARLLKKHALFQSVNIDHFHVVSDWYHLAILQLMDVRGFQSRPEWIAKHLRISEGDARKAVERLLRVGLIKKAKGRLEATNSFNTYSNGQPSETVRRFHLQILDRAKRALVFDSVDDRDLTAIVMSMNRQRYQEVTQKLKKIRREIAEDLSQDEEKDSVFCLSQQFFELKGNSPE